MEYKIIEAAENNDIKSMKTYLKIANSSVSFDRAIGWASLYGHTEIVRLLLQDGRANLAAFNNFALQQASTKGQTEIVRLLLEDGRADPSADNNRAIDWALRQRHLKIASLLLSDPRVDYNIDKKDEDLKQKILLEERKNLQNELKSKHQLLEKLSPQVTFEGKQKSQVPEEIIRKIIYQSVYQELCSIIPKKFLHLKLLALADLLKIKYDRTTSYAELCGKVKLVLLHL